MKKIIAIAAGSLLSLAAQAEGYASIGAGVSAYNQDCEGIRDCDNAAGAARVLAGYRFGNGLAIEALAIDFGKVKSRDGNVHADLKSQAVGAGLAYHYDVLPTLRLTGRGGVFSVKSKFEAHASGVAFRYSTSQTATKPYAGFGVAWSFAPNAYIEGGIDVTSQKVDNDNGGLASATFGIGVRF